MVDSPAPKLRLSFLGAPSIRRDDREVTLPVKAVGLLAYLAVNRESARRDRLLDLLWPDSGQDAGRKNLRNTLWVIRKNLGANVLFVEGERVTLASTARVDVRDFETALETDPSAATVLYRGPFLDGAGFINAAEFEIWIDGQRGRLGQLLLRALIVLADRHRTNGNWRGLVDVAERGIRQDRLHEAMHRGIIEGYARLGDRAEALRRYEALRASLAGELGVAPLPETQALRDSIVRGRIPSPRAGSGVGSSESTPSRGVGSPFVGRVDERTALDLALREAEAGHARVVLITGELGIGKSRLWQEWSIGFRSEATVVDLRCLDATQSLPFGPVIELLARPGMRDRVLAGSTPVAAEWLAEVARLAPQLRAARPDLPAAPERPPDEERGRIFEGLTQLLLGLRPRPLVFFVDDAHWADRTTLEWLRYLAYRLRDHPALLVLAFRADEAEPFLTHLLASWERDGVARRLPLARLTDGEANNLLTALGGLDEAKARLARGQADGNPYYLIELARSESNDVPPLLADLVRVRLDRVSEPARQVVQSAAVLDPDFDLELLRHTSGRGEEELLDALDELLAANALVEGDRGLAFAHPLIPMVVRQGLSGARRAFLSRRAAAALETRYDAEVAQVAGRLAELHAEGGNAGRAAHYSDLAAERALVIAAPDEAAAFYRRAIALEPTPGRRLALATALFRAGDLAGSRAAAEVAADEFERSGDRAGCVRAAVTLSEICAVAGQFADARRWAQWGLALVDHDADPESHGIAHFLTGLAYFTEADSLTEGTRQLEEAARIAATYQLNDVGARVQFTFGNMLAERGDLEAARASFRASIELAIAAGNQYQEVLGHNNAGYHAVLAGDLLDARQHVERGLALVDAYGLRLPRQYLYSTRAEIAIATEAWSEAIDWLNRGLAEAALYENVRQMAGYHANLALVERGRGDLDAAVALMETARQEASDEGFTHLHAMIDLWLTEIYQERGAPAAADAALARAEARLADGSRRGLVEWARALRARLHVAAAP